MSERRENERERKTRERTRELNESYIGECTRPVRYRFNEQYLSDARLRKTDTSLGEHIIHSHFDLTHAEVNTSFRIEIVDRGKDCADVKIKESIQIRNLKPTGCPRIIRTYTFTRISPLWCNRWSSGQQTFLKYPLKAKALNPWFHFSSIKGFLFLFRMCHAIFRE